MGAIDAAVAHFKSFGLQYIDVPEWGTGDVPLRIFFDPLTSEERDDLFKAGTPDDITVLLRKAKDEAGKKMFDLADKPKLRLFVSPHIINRIALRMLSMPNADQAEKN